MKTQNRKFDPARSKLLAFRLKPRGGTASTEIAAAPSVEMQMQTAMGHHQAGRLADAERIYRNILARHPAHADALHLCGVVHAQSGRFEAAAEMIGRAIEIKPSATAFYRNFANALKDSGQFDRAAGAFRHALRFEPGDAELHHRLGAVLLALGNLDDAISAFRDAVRLKATHAEAWNNLGMALAGAGQLDDAIAAYRRSIALHAMPQTWNNLGNALKKQEHLDQAIEAYRVAVQLAPDSADIRNNLGTVLRDRGLLDDAIVHLEHAVRVKPDMASAHWNLSLALLQRGELLRGWAEYEWRWRWKNFPTAMPRYAQPQWRGEDLNGRTILLHLEQGRGDVIQFIRYVPLLADRGANVIIHCPQEVVRLLQGVRGISRIVSSQEPIAFDVHSPLMSLPLAFGTTLESIPADVPYLHADLDLAREWGHRLGTGGENLNVGLVWAGNASHGNDKKRSIALAQLLPLANVPGITFYSVQKGEAGAQAANPPAGMELIDHTSELTDFADTAALISQLDLVIAVDTAVAHLAAAMGKKVWLLLPFVSDWRWLVDRDNPPWYPTMRLFRQQRAGDWAGVIERVASELRRGA